MQAHAVCSLVSLSCFFWHAASRLHRPLRFADAAATVATLALGLANALVLSHAYWTDDGLVLGGTMALVLLRPGSVASALAWVLLHVPSGHLVRTLFGALCWGASGSSRHLKVHWVVLLQYVAWFTACLSVVGD